jgi:predicted PurR-regulated permease PerM
MDKKSDKGFRIYIAICVGLITILLAGMLALFIYGGIKLSSASQTVNNKVNQFNSQVNKINVNLNKVNSSLQNLDKQLTSSSGTIPSNLVLK